MQSLSTFLLSGISISKTVFALCKQTLIVTGYLSPENYILDSREQEQRKDSIRTVKVNWR